jgi:outer membrane protein OmpA-like peptidoglycan-associated protein
MKRKVSQESNWISFSDLMTGLMIIFMFIALNYIIQVIEYKFIEEEIYNKLSKEFVKEIEEGQIELGNDGAVKFPSSSDDIMYFESGNQRITKDFGNILNDFVPRYLDIVSDSNYIDYIKELRIEGHTDIIPPRSGEDSYTYNLRLSSFRAQSVLHYVRNHKAFVTLDKNVRERLEFLFTANGLSYSRALNKNKEIAYLSENDTIDNDHSRRVEFRIITSNESLIEHILTK